VTDQLFLLMVFYLVLVTNTTTIIRSNNLMQMHPTQGGEFKFIGTLLLHLNGKKVSPACLSSQVNIWSVHRGYQCVRFDSGLMGSQLMRLTHQLR